jgi:hypothetical protein
MKGQWISYSAKELAWIEARKDQPRRELHEAFIGKFGRTDVTLTNFKALCKRKGWMTGRTGQFFQGQVSHNKGQKGVCAPGSEKGWFKAGVRQGIATKLYKPIGTERVSKEGYIERKINDDLPLYRRWRMLHLINWEALNGPVPDGHRLKCLDGDRSNTDPANWQAIPNALAPRLNGRFGRGYDQAPAELKPVIMATAQLEHAVREKRKGAK